VGGGADDLLDRGHVDDAVGEQAHPLLAQEQAGDRPVDRRLGDPLVPGSCLQDLDSPDRIGRAEDRVDARVDRALDEIRALPELRKGIREDQPVEAQLPPQRPLDRGA
jgi:hypothetical protein